jgi:hypothetical protein
LLLLFVDYFEEVLFLSLVRKVEERCLAEDWAINYFDVFDQH